MATPADLTRALSTSLLGRLGAGIELAAVPLLVHAYGLQTYGAYAIMAAALTLGLGSLDLGLSGAVQRAIPQATPGEARALTRLAMLAGTAPAFLLGLAGAAGAAWLAPAHPVAFALMALALPLSIGNELGGAVARAHRRFGPDLTLRMFAEPALRLALALLFAGAGTADLPTLALAHLLASAMVALLMARLVRRCGGNMPAESDPAAARAMFRRGVALAPGALLRRALADGPLLLLGALLPGAPGQQAAALFALARKLASVPQMLRTLIASVVPPLAAGADPAALATLAASAQRLAAALALPLGAALAATTPALLALMGGPLAGALVPALLLIAARSLESLAAPAAALTDTLSPPRVPLAIAAAGALLAAALGAALLQTSLPSATAMASAVALAIVTMSAAAMLAARAFTGLPAVAGIGGSFAGASVAALVAVFGLLVPPSLGVALGLAGWLAGGWLALRFGLAAPDHAALGRTAAMLRLQKPRNTP